MRSLSAAGAPAAGGTTDLSDNNDYYDDSVTLQFALNFNAIKCGVWWLLFVLALGYGLLKRNVVSRAWFIYAALIIILGFNGVQTSCYVAYAKHVEEGHNGIVAYLIYIAFFNLSRSAFLAVLLVVASGYCITRSDLGPHRGHVVWVPSVVLVTGLVTDYIYFLVILGSNTDNVTNDFSSMSKLGALTIPVWFVCSVLNLAALIMSWLYLFEALGKETAALEDEYKERTGKASVERAAAAETAAVALSINGYNTLQGGPGGAVPTTRPGGAVALSSGVEAGGRGEGEGEETVADHLAYTAKRRLLSRFAYGVTAYLLADICVLLLPVFVNNVVQSTLQVLLFACYAGFLLVLLVLFRPQEQSSYLMVGFSEEDAEARGVTGLATGIAMADMGRGDGSDSDYDNDMYGGSAARRGNGGGAGGNQLGSGGSAPAVSVSSGGAAAGGAAVANGGGGGAVGAVAKAAARAAKVAAKAATRVVKKSGDAERYQSLPSAGHAAGGSAGAAAGGDAVLPVSTMTMTARGGLPPPPAYSAAPSALAGAGAGAGPQRGRHQRKYVPQDPGSSSFTLGEDEDEDDSMPLKGRA